MHGLIARQAKQHLPIEIHPLPFQWTKLDEVLQWHSHRSRDAGLVWLRDIFPAGGKADDDFPRRIDRVNAAYPQS